MKLVKNLLGFVLCLAVIAAFTLAHAQTISLSINGAAKCAAAQSGNNFTGVVDRACQNQPPPTPGFAANAVTYQQLKYITSTTGNAPVNSVPVRDFTNVAGRHSSRDDLEDFDYAGGSTWQMPGIRGDQVWQTLIRVPTDVALGHMYSFKGVLYGSGVGVGALRSSRYPIDVQVYEVDSVGRFMPIPGVNGTGVRIGSVKTNVLMNDNALVYFVTGATANQSFMPIYPGHTYVIEIKWHGLAPTTRGDFMFSWIG